MAQRRNLKFKRNSAELRHSSIFKKLSDRYRTPRQVQRLLRSLSYNREKTGDTMRSALTGWRRQEVHCLEAVLLACAILEHRGYPPLVMSIDSLDKLGHVIFVFKTKTGWGSVGRSRVEGLHGRAPMYRNLHALARSYWTPFIDKTGRVTSYALCDLRQCKVDWRFAARDVWGVEKFFIRQPHRSMRGSTVLYKRVRAHFLRTGEPCARRPTWW